jgi:hypothetical protein
MNDNVEEQEQFIREMKQSQSDERIENDNDWEAQKAKHHHFTDMMATRHKEQEFNANQELRIRTLNRELQKEYAYAERLKEDFDILWGLTGIKCPHRIMEICRNDSEDQDCMRVDCWLMHPGRVDNKHRLVEMREGAMKCEVDPEVWEELGKRPLERMLREDYGVWHDQSNGCGPDPKECSQCRWIYKCLSDSDVREIEKCAAQHYSDARFETTNKKQMSYAQLTGGA